MSMPSASDIQDRPLSPTPAAAPRQYSSKLGEELPIFCERCGYSLNGLPMMRCADCKILQFKCPECGHHQPINTLRPAAQRVLGRLRALWLCFSVLFKLNFFGWLLFAWVAMGVEWSYRYNFVGARTVRTMTSGGGVRASPQYSMVPREIDWESLLAFSLFGLGFGLFGRMFLLRWRRGHLIGMVLGVLVVGMVMLGARIQQIDRNLGPSPYTPALMTVAVMGAGLVVLGAWISWGVWVLLVRLFLPTRTATAFLEWQRSLSSGVGKLAQE
jgi:hypothetical protein